MPVFGYIIYSALTSSYLIVHIEAREFYLTAMGTLGYAGECRVSDRTIGIRKTNGETGVCTISCCDQLDS